MRFYQFTIGQSFQTAPVEILGGFTARQFVKCSKSYATEAGKRVRFHPLNPVFITLEN